MTCEVCGAPARNYLGSGHWLCDADNDDWREYSRTVRWDYLWWLADREQKVAAVASEGDGSK